MRRAVFLDRDGVLNRAIVLNGLPYPPQNLTELEILPGVSQALTALRQAGFLLIVVTNQPDVKRGTVSKLTVDSMNNYLFSHLCLDQVRTCYHDNNDACMCRKPLPGMLFEAAKDFDIDLSNSFIVGDRWRDVEAGERAGCQTFFIDYGYFEAKPNNPNYTVSSLLEAQQIILGECI